MSRFGVFNINGVTYDLDDLTLDEIEQIEDLAGGVAFSEINYGAAKGMKAFTFVLLKRSNPDVTMEEVGAVKVASFAEADEEMPELPPADQAEQTSGESEEGDSGPRLSVASTDG